MNNTQEKNITVTPVTMSGVGNYIVVNINSKMYKSEVMQGEFTQDVMDKMMAGLLDLVPQEDREKVELKYYTLCTALRNTETEQVSTQDMLVMPEEQQSQEVIEPIEEIA